MIADGSPGSRPASSGLRRHGVRVLLALVAVGVLSCSWLVVRMHKAAKQQEAVQAIADSGGWVHYSSEPSLSFMEDPVKASAPAWLRSLLGDQFFVSVVKVVFCYPVCRDSPLRECDLVCLKSLPDVRELVLCEVGVTDKELAYLKRFKNLRTLNLTGSPITDSGLASLAEMPDIENIDLSDTKISDDGISHLSTLKNLRSLSLRSTKITDKGMSHIAALTTLETLDVADNAISDAGLDQIRPLTNLQSLNIWLTCATNAWVRDFHRRLPQCKITPNPGDE